MQHYRDDRLQRAFRIFRSRHGEKEGTFRDFCDKNVHWLEDFALFMALRQIPEANHGPNGERICAHAGQRLLLAARQRLKEEIAFHQFIQFKFDQQWKAFREESHRRGIGLIGDIPIFVSHDSADVWSHQELFQLNGHGNPGRLSGYPPDRFNRNGQLWGHPQYEWAAHKLNDFTWWVQRFARMYDLFDALRIDHFLGFTRTWSIPAGLP